MFCFPRPKRGGEDNDHKMVHCVSPITSGTVNVFGEAAGLDNRKIKMMTGIIPQEINLDSGLTVYENLMVFAKFFDIPAGEAKKRIEELLEFVELEVKKKAG